MRLTQPFSFGSSEVFLMSFIDQNKSKIFKSLFYRIFHTKTHVLLIFTLFQVAINSLILLCTTTPRGTRTEILKLEWPYSR